MENVATETQPELTEIQKAEKLIADNKLAKDKEFSDKYNALMAEYGKEITAQTNISFVDKK